jgi:predicted nucleotidyltransferase
MTPRTSSNGRLSGSMSPTDAEQLAPSDVFQVEIRIETSAIWKIPNLGIKIPKMGIQKKSPNRKRPLDRRVAVGRIRSQPTGSLIDALFTSTQQRLLALLFGQPNRTFFTTELIGLAESGTGAVQRELRRLTDAGLVTLTKQGNQKHYQANRTAPVFGELRGIVLKTVGLVEPIQTALASVKDRIQLALVFGSVAKHADTASSDVDLLIVSDSLLLEEAYGALAPAERLISRKINVTMLTPEEFVRRRTDKSPFLSNVLAGEHLVLIGDTDGIATTRKSGPHSTA